MYFYKVIVFIIYHCWQFFQLFFIFFIIRPQKSLVTYCFQKTPFITLALGLQHIYYQQLLLLADIVYQKGVSVPSLFIGWFHVMNYAHALYCIKYYLFKKLIQI